MTPEIGMGATIVIGTDCIPATIIFVSLNKKKILLQEDKCCRLDSNGMDENQSYSYESDSNGKTYFAYLRKNNLYYLSRAKQKIILNYRRRYYDYSF